MDTGRQEWIGNGGKLVQCQCKSIKEYRKNYGNQFTNNNLMPKTNLD